MAEVHRLKDGGPSFADIELAKGMIQGVSGSLGVVAMMAQAVHDDEMVLDPRELGAMIDLMRGQLVRVQKQMQWLS